MAKVKEIQEANVFSEGMLVVRRFHTGWSAATGASDSEMGNLPVEIIRGVKSLLTEDGKERLRNLNSIMNEAKGFISRNSMPHPIPTLDFVPKHKIEFVDEGLRQRQINASACFEELVENYESAKLDYKKRYPDHYQPEKYPTVSRLRAGFVFEWSFRVFTSPSKEMSVLPASLYKEEVAKFKSEVQEMKDMAVDAIGKELLKKVNSLKEQCSSENVATATVNSVHNFLDKFDDLWDGFVAHKELRKMIQELKNYMDGTDAEMLRADDSFRNMVEKKMTKIADQLTVDDGILAERSLDF